VFGFDAIFVDWRVNKAPKRAPFISGTVILPTAKRGNADVELFNKIRKIQRLTGLETQATYARSGLSGLI